MKLFFSWQADTPTTGGRNLLERALESAIKELAQELEIDPAARPFEVDRDTKGVGGSQPIVDTIFRKIDEAAIFIGDMTFVGTRLDGRPTPNPNVLIEYGWALKSRSYSRIITVMNVAYGAPKADSMPFNMRHLRNPVEYDCPDNLDETKRREVRQQLASLLKSRLREMLASEEFQRDLAKPPQQDPFVPMPSADGNGRFRAPGKPLGIANATRFGATPQQVFLRPGNAMWLRVMPTVAGKDWAPNELQERATRGRHIILPIGSMAGDYGYMRSNDGFGIYATMPREEASPLVVFIFRSGEIWTVDTVTLSAGERQDPPILFLDEAHYAAALNSYSEFLSDPGVPPPYEWIAGMEGLTGRRMFIPTAPGHMSLSGPQGHGVENSVVEKGRHRPGDDPTSSLAPFFEEIYRNCCLERPAWLRK